MKKFQVYINEGIQMYNLVWVVKYHMGLTEPWRVILPASFNVDPALMKNKNILP